MLAIKSVKQQHAPSGQLLGLMEIFRQMTNDCLRVGVQEHKTSMKSLSSACYRSLKDYAVPSAYKLCAISRAAGILSNYRKLLKKGRAIKEPYCLRPSLTTCYRLRVRNGSLLIPGKMMIPLNDYVLKGLEGDEVRSVTISQDSLSISYRHTVEARRCVGVVGVDTNLRNVTFADSFGRIKRLGMEEVVEAKTRCRSVKARFRRNDVRVQQRLFMKYGKLQADKTRTEIHKVTARIVEHANSNQFAIVQENLRDIRKLYRKGNGQGRSYRSRMNSWSFGECQRQIGYKAKWLGLPVIYVNARGTSAKCSICGDHVFAEENRQLRCASCRRTVDRDVNAALNLAARGLEKLFPMRFKPVGPAIEAMVQEPQHTVILKVDAGKLTRRLHQNEPTS